MCADMAGFSLVTVPSVDGQVGEGQERGSNGSSVHADMNSVNFHSASKLTEFLTPLPLALTASVK